MSSLDLADEVDAAAEDIQVEGFGSFFEGEAHRGIQAGRWEDYDPWDSGALLGAMSGDCEGASSVFKMFLGILPLSVGSPDDDPPMRLCPLPVELTTAYRVLRPLFAPKRAPTGSREEFLSASNWVLDPTATMHQTRYPETNEALHPHLALEKTLVALPPLNPGDYVLWHPDTIHAHPSITYINTAHTGTLAEPQPLPPLPTPNGHWSPIRKESPSPPPPPGATTTTTLHLPCTPLTLANATYLARQRRAFILGFPAPDFIAPGVIGESCHMGRPGVQEVNEAGGEAALRGMGLLAWDVDEARDEEERRLLEGANAVLFPDGG